MKTRTLVILLALTFFVIALSGPVSAARPVPPSNETSNLYVEISASAVGSLKSDTEVVFTQGNGNIHDASLAPGEGQATIVYAEKTVATSGSIEYDQTVSLDTASQTAPQNNLETTRSIDYANTGDGNAVGRMYSTETVVVTEAATAAGSEGEICCPFPGATEDNILPATCLIAETGSEVDLKEGSVDSEGTARTVSANVGETVEMTYSVDVEGSGQTGNETAVGTAMVYVDVINKEGGGGDGTNQSTDMSYEETVSVSGLIELSMRTGYESGE